jgi:small-conductance mechanosensitive channel
MLDPPILSSSGSEDALAFMEHVGIYVIVMAGLVLVTIYGFVFLRRGIRYLKMMESKFIDDSILDFLELAIKVIWALLVMFGCLLMMALASDWFWVNVWTLLVPDPGEGIGYIAPFMMCIIVTMVFGLAIKFIHHILQYQAGNLKEKPKHSMNPRIALLIEILMKYFLIAFGATLIITIALGALGYYDVIIGGTVSWLDDNKAGIIFIFIIIILAYFFVKVLETFFEDMKKKETPFSPQIMDVAKLLSRYTIYIILGISLIFSLLQMFNLPQTGLIIVAVIIVFIGLVVAVAATSNLRNGFSGIILMAFKPFDEGDRVKILDGMVCDVLTLGIIFTRVRTLRGEIVDIPNNEILNRAILNYSKSDDYAISITVTIPHETNREKVKDLLISSALNTEGILQNLTPEVFAIGMEADKIVLELLAYTITPRRLKHIKSDLVHNVAKALKDEGIQCSVHIADEDEVERMKAIKGQVFKKEHFGL